MKYKILLVAEDDLPKVLELHYKAGYELVKFLSSFMPDRNSDQIRWKILLRSIKKA